MKKTRNKKDEELYRKAFADARADLDETNVFNVEEKAKELTSKRLGEMLGFVDEKFILTHNKEKGFVFLGGEKLTPEQIMNLKSEAEIILTSTMWKIFYNSIGDIARKAMFEKSETFQDMLSGKMLLYHLSLQKNILDLFKKYESKK